MPRQKAEQHSSFQGSSASIPISARETTQTFEQTRRKWRSKTREVFLMAFEKAFQDHIREWISNNRKKITSGKAILRAGRSLPKGFSVKVDYIADLE